MAFQRIRIKNTNVAGKVPGADKLDTAELCINLKDHKLYSKDVDGDVFELVGGSVETGPTPPGSGNNTGDLFWDGDFLLVWNGTEWEQVAGNLQNVLDKGNTATTELLISDNGKTVKMLPSGRLEADDYVKAEMALYAGTDFKTNSETGVTASGTGSIQISKRSGSTDLIYAASYFSNLTKVFSVDYESHVTTDGGITSVFGTSTAQIGNVAPLNDWSCYPARV